MYNILYAKNEPIHHIHDNGDKVGQYNIEHLKLLNYIYLDVFMGKQKCTFDMFKGDSFYMSNPNHDHDSLTVYMVYSTYVVIGKIYMHASYVSPEVRKKNHSIKTNTFFSFLELVQ